MTYWEGRLGLRKGSSNKTIRAVAGMICAECSKPIKPGIFVRVKRPAHSKCWKNNTLELPAKVLYKRDEIARKCYPGSSKWKNLVELLFDLPCVECGTYVPAGSFVKDPAMPLCVPCYVESKREESMFAKSQMLEVGQVHALSNRAKQLG